jgi:hypothetical protein
MSSILKLEITMFFNICNLDVYWCDVVDSCCDSFYFETGINLNVSSTTVDCSAVLFFCKEVDFLKFFAGLVMKKIDFGFFGHRNIRTIVSFHVATLVVICLISRA